MASPILNNVIAQARAADLARAARGLRPRPLKRKRKAGRDHEPASGGLELAVTIRYAFPDDMLELARLAALDSREVPTGPVLLCELDGQLRAALSIASGAVVADPFCRTVALVELLRARAEQLRPVVQARTGREPLRAPATMSVR